MALTWQRVGDVTERGDVRTITVALMDGLAELSQRTFSVHVEDGKAAVEKHLKRLRAEIAEELKDMTAANAAVDALLTAAPTEVS